MDPERIINKYYKPGTAIHRVLVEHSEAVAEMALSIVQTHPELEADQQFIYEACMLHDIGIFQTRAEDLHCFGSYPYISHGYLGRELLEKEGFPRHALVCERHTGAGLSLQEIREQALPLPQREMRPVSVEEEIICFADKFFSKSGALRKPKPITKVRSTLAKYGPEQLRRFDDWSLKFL